MPLSHHDEKRCFEPTNGTGDVCCPNVKCITHNHLDKKRMDAATTVVAAKVAKNLVSS
jgi:hypothetical protein